jgi:hypothetical protein
LGILIAFIGSNLIFLFLGVSSPAALDEDLMLIVDTVEIP